MAVKERIGGKTMSMQICIEMGSYDWLIASDESHEQIEERMKNALLFDKYRNGEISIGQIAEHTGRSIEEAMDWLATHGIYSNLSSETLSITRKNREAYIKDMKKTL